MGWTWKKYADEQTQEAIKHPGRSAFGPLVLAVCAGSNYYLGRPGVVTYFFCFVLFGLAVFQSCVLARAISQLRDGSDQFPAIPGPDGSASPHPVPE